MLKMTLRVLLYLFLVAIVIGISWYWLERSKVITTNITVPFINNVFNRNKDNVTAIPLSQDNMLLDKLRIEKKEEQLEILRLELAQKEQTLLDKEFQIQQEIASIENTKTNIQNQQNNINQITKQIENKNERVMQVAESLINMPPQNAVDILVQFDDELLIDTLQSVNQLATDNGTTSIVPYWLSLMDAGRAGEVQKKLVYK